jgi:hypothetical protein
MEKGFFGYRFATTEVKHTNENKVYIQIDNILTSP